MHELARAFAVQLSDPFPCDKHVKPGVPFVQAFDPTCSACFDKVIASHARSGIAELNQLLAKTASEELNRYPNPDNGDDHDE